MALLRHMLQTKQQRILAAVHAKEDDGSVQMTETFRQESVLVTEDRIRGCFVGN